MAKVHITLARGVAGSREQRERARARIEAVSGITDVNEKRLDRYGIVSGEVAPERLDDLRDLHEVQAVEIDDTKHAR